MHKVHGFLVIACAAIVLLALTACGALGVQSPQTFSQRLATGYVTVTGVRSMSNTMLAAQKIGSADHQNIEQQADNARAGLDIASNLAKVDQSSAEAKLTSVLTVLDALETYVLSKENQP